ncbi:diacylglycerol/polyprenol kinase family protein [Treponema sp.]|uniref:diacylglycerol/polyprenol kinase family protein n=1 Tax=Treponema sp. TaxID=166 RepID=UPI0025CE0FBA|nr:diacylglycerol/polyprenol kinase family protein [Treponema sp.]MCR5217159.1 SEC59/DGK1/VTE5 family protein [Treponema sp.]
MIFRRRLDGIVSRQRINLITKEIFRKSIHLCSATIPFLLKAAYWPVLILLCSAVIFYSVCEFLRLKGHTVPLITEITNAAARKRDENKFVKGPVTLCTGIIITALLFDPVSAAVGILALSFGDGLASLCGKLFGRVTIPFTEGKTVAGSLSCFTAIYISCAAVCQIYGIAGAGRALVIAGAGMLIEVMPIKDMDNILIPILLAGLFSVL